MKKVALFISLLLIFSVIESNAQKRKSKTKRKKTNIVRNYEEPITQNYSKTLIVNAGNMTWQPIFLYKDSFLSGEFTAQGGSGNDIQCFIVNESGLTNLRNGHAARNFYHSGVVTVDNFGVYLSEGQYYILFSNKMSLFSNKVVTLNYSIK